MLKKKSHISIPLRIVSLQGNGYHLLLNAKVNGKPVRFILDTGASKTVMDQNIIHGFIEQAPLKKHEELSSGLGTNSMETHVVILEKFSIGKLVLKNYEMVTIDMKHINQSYEMLRKKPFHGVLGGDILFDYEAVINYSEKILLIKI